MWAVIEVGGKQYRIKEGDTISVERLKEKEGKISLDKVLLVCDNSEVLVGSPYLNGVSVEGEVIEEKKDKKVIIYKYKRRKKYRRKKGHRQIKTILKILKIHRD